DTVELTILDAVSPLTNEVNQLITDWITTNITPILNTIISDLTNLVSDNSTGGLIGGIVGSVAGLFLPGGPLLVAVGSIVGAGVEAIIKAIAEGVAEEEITSKRLEITLNKLTTNVFDFFVGNALRWQKQAEDRDQAEIDAKVDAQEFRDNFERNRRLGGETLSAIKNVERIINENFAEEQEERRTIVEEQRRQRRLGVQQTIF
ncbi:hypothetical protein LCGC14_2040430, partial [marine sediment metagenome]